MHARVAAPCSALLPAAALLSTSFFVCYLDLLSNVNLIHTYP
jgi:hypothetical protein